MNDLAAGALRLASALAVCVALLLPSSAAAQVGSGLMAQLGCRASQQPSALVELMFGRKIGDRVGVSDAEWERFLDDEITPRFPGGLTVIDAAGQWRDPVRNLVVREPSKIVSIVLRDLAEGETGIDAIVDAYKKKFRQQAVGVIVRPACVSFQ